MQIVKTTSFFLVVIVSFMSLIKNSSSGYLEIQYEGTVDKPFPRVIFYLDGSLSNPLIDTIMSNSFEHMYKISSAEFEKLKRQVEKTKFSNISKSHNREVSFTIIVDNSKIVYFGSGKYQLKLLFDRIPPQLENDEFRRSVRVWLENILQRMPD